MEEIKHICEMTDEEIEEMYGDLLEEDRKAAEEELDEMHELCASVYIPEDFEEGGEDAEVNPEEEHDLGINECEWY